MKRLWLVWLLLLLGACSQSSVPIQQRQLYVFGTLVEIQAVSPDEAAFSAAMAELQQVFSTLHEQWHAWKGNGLLVRLNRAFAEGRCLALEPGLERLLVRAREAEAASGGLFNPAIGRLVALWGFHTDDFPVHGPPPEPEAIRALVAARPSMRDIRIAGGRVCSANPSVALDLGGFAKGLAVDVALEILSRHGMAGALVNAGGDLAVRGHHGQRDWRVAVRHPVHGRPLVTIPVADGEAVFTSGNYYRYREHAGSRYAHILDPRMGYPVDEVLSATVIAEDAAWADAAATALVVAGTRGWMDVVRGMGLSQAMLVTADGTVHLTPAMKGRIQYVEPPVRERVWPL